MVAFMKNKFACTAKLLVQENISLLIGSIASILWWV